MHWVDAIYYPSLVKRLEHLDEVLDDLGRKASLSPDPDGEGFLDDVEDIVGEGFFHCQRYMIHRKGPGRRAFACGPRHGTQYVAEIINAGSNYWKHFGEWPHAGSLRPNQRATLDAIRDAGVTGCDYLLSNLLYGLDEHARLSRLLPHIEGWRVALDKVRKADTSQASP